MEDTKKLIAYIVGELSKAKEVFFKTIYELQAEIEDIDVLGELYLFDFLFEQGVFKNDTSSFYELSTFVKQEMTFLLDTTDELNNLVDDMERGVTRVRERYTKVMEG